MTPKQIRTIQTAKRTLGLDDAHYRMILRNTGKVDSSKDLSNRAYEQVMAVFEEMGFQTPANPTYWRDKSVGGGTRESLSSAERMDYKIRELARQATTYPLGAMVRRQSDGRTDRLGELTNQERWQLIEAYKGILDRQRRESRQGGLFGSPGPAEGSADPGVREGPARTRATGTDADVESGPGRNASQPPGKPRAGSKPAADLAVKSADGAVDPDDDIPF